MSAQYHALKPADKLMKDLFLDSQSNAVLHYTVHNTANFGIDPITSKYRANIGDIGGVGV